MLRLSENATAALDNVRAAQGLPESYGVRLSGGQQPDGNLIVNLDFVETPQEADQVIEQPGADVYVAPEIAGPLSSALMDVRAADEGLELVLREQDPQA